MHKELFLTTPNTNETKKTELDTMGSFFDLITASEQIRTHAVTLLAKHNLNNYLDEGKVPEYPELKKLTKPELLKLKAAFLYQADEADAVMNLPSIEPGTKRYNVAQARLLEFDLAADIVNGEIADRNWQESPIKKTIDWTKDILKKGKERWLKK